MPKYLVQSVTKAATKGGKKYLRLKLFDDTGRQWPGVMWEDRDLETGVLIDALTEQSDYNGEAQLNVKAFRVLSEKPTDAFLPRSKNDVDALLVELNSFVLSVSSGHLQAILAKAVRDDGHESERRWRRGVAAKTMHHAFLGGLLEHTVNLCRLADAVSKLYPVLRRDLLITAAILHDIGKLDELTSDVNIEYTTDGNLLGHIVIGILRIDKWMDELGTPDETRRLVRHLIISHHGNLNFGSPKTPQIMEAQIFSNLDGLDAGMGAMLAAIEKAVPGKEWSDKVGFGQPLYLGPPKETT